MFQYMVCLESYNICEKTCKPYAGPYYGQFMIFMYAMLLYAQFMTFMQACISAYDLVFISYFCMLVNSCIFIAIVIMTKLSRFTIVVTRG